MMPSTTTTAAVRSIFTPKPTAGSGLRIAARYDRAPGHSGGGTVIVLAPAEPPPGSGTTTLTERDKRLTARHAERRRRVSHGVQGGSAQKNLQQREQERVAFQRDIDASKQAPHNGQPVPAEREASSHGERVFSSRPPQPSALQRAAQSSAHIGAGDAGGGLNAVLSKKATARAAREAVYEEKRRRYLAARRDSNGNEPQEPRVHFRGDKDVNILSSLQTEQPHAVVRTLDADGKNRPNANDRGRAAFATNLEQDSPLSEKVSLPNKPRTRDDVLSQQNPASAHGYVESDRAHRNTPAAPEGWENGALTPAITAEDRKADFARTPREHMTGSSAAAHRTRGGMTFGQPVEGLNFGPPSAPRLAEQNDASNNSINHLHLETRKVNDGTGNRSPAGAVVDRKALYARQLREQMAADKAARRAASEANKRPPVGVECHESSTRNAAAGAAGAGAGAAANGNVSRNGAAEGATAISDPKAEYARQLREQMMEAQDSRLAQERRNRGELSPSRDNQGWLEEAGVREQQRREAKAEYAEQLREQMTAQRRSRDDEARSATAGRNSRQTMHPSEWQATAPAHAGRLDYLALERQKQVEHQRAYAAALRRDMAAPKVDSLGRPAPDLTGTANKTAREHRNITTTTISNNSSNTNGLYYSRERGRHDQEEHDYLQQSARELSRRESDGDTYQGRDNEQQLRHRPFEEYSKRSAPNHALSSLQQQQQQQQQQHSGGAFRQQNDGVVYRDSGYHHGEGAGANRSTNEGWRGSPPFDQSRQQQARLQPQPHLGRELQTGSWGANKTGDRWFERQDFQHNPSVSSSGYNFEPNVATTQRAGYDVPSSSRDRSGTTRGAGAGDDRRSTPWENTSTSLAISSGQYQDHFGGHSSGGSVSGLPGGGNPSRGDGHQNCRHNVAATRASAMHNPLGVEELARIRAKKDAYRRDLEKQVADHRERMERQKHGEPEPGSKEAEVFLLQQVMEKRTGRQEMAPGYEMGPLGVPVFKDTKSGSRREQKPTHDEVSTSTGHEKISNLVGSNTYNTIDGTRAAAGSSTSAEGLSATENRGTGITVGAEGLAANGSGEQKQQKRGQGLRNLLGADEADVEKERERSMQQAAALTKQVMDNKVRRDSEKALMEEQEFKEEARLHKEREQQRKRYEEEGTTAKAIESAKLLREAEEARRIAAARKEAEAARLREQEIRDNERVEREMIELKRKYEKERAAEAPLNQNSHGTDAVVLSEFPEAKRRSPNGREDANTMVSAHNTAAETTNGATTQCNATANFDGKPRLSAEGEADARRPASSADIGAVTLKENGSMTTGSTSVLQTCGHRRKNQSTTDDSTKFRARGDDVLPSAPGERENGQSRGGELARARRSHMGTTSGSAMPPLAPRTNDNSQYEERAESSIEHLKAELRRQKQLAEVLREEVGQREKEKQQLLDLARTAKESEAAALRAAFERRSSRQTELAGTNSATIVGSKELWRVPSPPECSPDVDHRKTNGFGLAKGKLFTPNAANQHPANRRGGDASEQSNLEEDRLLLAGLRSNKSGIDETGAGARSTGLTLSPREGEISGDSTFRNQPPGATAWSNAETGSNYQSANREAVGNNGSSSKSVPRLPFAQNYGDVPSPGGIRASSRYVFPDGTVRRGLPLTDRQDSGGDHGSNLGAERKRDGVGVPMLLVGTSRINSADLSCMLGLDALHPGLVDGNDQHTNTTCVGDSGRGAEDDTSGARNALERGGGGGGAYRGPGAAPGASFAPGGRPPRAYVPFLNLPKFSDAKGRSRQRDNAANPHQRHRNDSGLSFTRGHVGSSRHRPLAGVGGVLVSAGRAMLTGPGRPGTGGTSSWRSSSPSALLDADGGEDEANRHRRWRRRRSGSTGGNRDGDASDGDDSVGSGSTDVEFLRRLAEAKLRSLERREAAEAAAAGKDIDALVKSPRSLGSRTSSRGLEEEQASTRRSPVARRHAGGVVQIHHERRSSSNQSTASDNGVLYGGSYRAAGRRSGTRQSEGSMQGDSRWATRQAN